MSLWHKLNALLLIALVITALAVVRSNYRARTLATALADAQSQQHRLETEYRQLQLEQALWSSASRVEKIAREQLSMQFPDTTRTVHLTAPVKKATP